LVSLVEAAAGAVVGAGAAGGGAAEGGDDAGAALHERSRGARGVVGRGGGGAGVRRGDAAGERPSSPGRDTVDGGVDGGRADAELSRAARLPSPFMAGSSSGAAREGAVARTCVRRRGPSRAAMTRHYRRTGRR